MQFYMAFQNYFIADLPHRAQNKDLLAATIWLVQAQPPKPKASSSSAMWNPNQHMYHVQLVLT